MKKGPMAHSAAFLTLSALLDDLWESDEWLIDKFDPPRTGGRKLDPARPILDGLVYHFRTGCKWN
jgi:transposase